MLDTSSPLSSGEVSASELAIRADAQALRRGVTANLIGYGFAVLQPPLAVLVVRAYGAETFGVYTAANTVLWLALRFGLLGLDKGLLWWVARAGAASAQSAIRASLFWVTAASAATAAVIAGVLTPLLARWSGLEGVEPVLRAMCAGLIPMSLTELLLCVGLAQRRVGAKVFVRDGLLPTSFAAVALLAHAFGYRGPAGLAGAFLVSHLSSLVAAGLTLRRSLPARMLTLPGVLPVELVRYTRSAFAAELVNSLSQRIDVLIVAALTDARSVGVWAAVMQIGNVVRAIRRSFDPIVMTTFAQIGALPERRRLARSFSHATRLIVTTQTPVLAFLMAFAAPLLGLFGAGFDVGAPAAVTLCACWYLNGLIGLNGSVVSGFGRSDWLLLDLVVATLALAGLLVLLLPPFGLLGAAFSVGASYTLQSALQAWQARRVAGIWPYERRVFQVFALSLLSLGALALVRVALEPLGVDAAAGAGFAASTLVFGGGLLLLRRR